MTLSTGETVHLPLETEATMLGAVFPAPRQEVEALLPDQLAPIRVTPRGKAAVTVLSVAYHHIGAGKVEPYNEVAIIIPATHTSRRSIPYLSALTHATSGYMWYLPVTTPAAKALGIEVWGFPKVTADITHHDTDSTRNTVVNIEDERFLTFEAIWPPSIHTTDTGTIYTHRDGDLVAVPTTVDAELGGWPLTTKAALEFGDHPRAAPLRQLDIEGRALARLSVVGTATFHPATPLR